MKNSIDIENKISFEDTYNLALQATDWEGKEMPYEINERKYVQTRKGLKQILEETNEFKSHLEGIEIDIRSLTVGGGGECGEGDWSMNSIIINLQYQQIPLAHYDNSQYGNINGEENKEKLYELFNSIKSRYVNNQIDKWKKEKANKIYLENSLIKEALQKVDKILKK